MSAPNVSPSCLRLRQLLERASVRTVVVKLAMWDANNGTQAATVNQDAVRKWARGDHVPKPDTRGALEEVFGIPADGWKAPGAPRWGEHPG